MERNKNYDEECWEKERQPNREMLACMVERGGRFLYFRGSPYSAKDGSQELLFRSHISKLIADECNISKKYRGVSGQATPAGQRYLLAKASAILPRFANGIGGIDYRHELHTLEATVYFSVFPQIMWDAGCFDFPPDLIPPDELLYKNSEHLGYLIFTACKCDLCLTTLSD